MKKEAGQLAVRVLIACENVSKDKSKDLKKSICKVINFNLKQANDKEQKA